MFKHQTKTITFAAFLLALSSLISRLLGLLRDRLLAGQFGAGEQLDIYFAAFRIPDFVYGVLIAGGITAAFLPVFSGYFQKQDDSEQKEGEWSSSALEFTNNILNCFLILLVVLCGILAIFTPFIIKFVVPGFSAADKSLTITLTRLMFLSPILLGLSSIFSGVLQYFNRFLAYALTPILYNLGIIFGILFFVPIFGVYGLAFGVILGAVMHVLIQVPAAISSGFKFKFILDFFHSGLLKIFKLAIPRIIGTAAGQITLIVITALASALAVGSISVFNFSNNIRYFPVGIIGLSFAVSAFPVFSRHLINGRKEEFVDQLALSLRQILFFIVPSCVFFFIFRAQIVRVILGTGQFDWQATRLTAACLGVFCVGILSESLIHLLVRAFFAFQDTKTPVIIGLISVVVTIIFCILFVFLLGFANPFHDFVAKLLKLKDIKNIEVVGLPFGVSLGGLVQLTLLSFFLYRKIGNFKISDILNTFKKALLASIVLGVLSYPSLYFLARFLDTKTFLGIFLQAAIAGTIGILGYLGSAYLLKMPEVKVIKTAILRQFIKSDI